MSDEVEYVYTLGSISHEGDIGFVEVYRTLEAAKARVGADIQWEYVREDTWEQPWLDDWEDSTAVIRRCAVGP
jgi:hypothetical protein